MAKIKFSHYYYKLLSVAKEQIYTRKAKLLETIPVNLEDLYESFIAYDTDLGKYALPKKGKYILLILEKDNQEIFTTIRRFTPQKFEYYKGKRGETFEVVIDDSEHCSHCRDGQLHLTHPCEVCGRIGGE